MHQSEQRKRGKSLSWQKEAAPASKTNNKATDNVHYLCLPCHSKQRCTVRTLFMLWPLWQREDKLPKKLKMFVCTGHLVVISYYSNACWQSKAHHSLTVLTYASVPTHKNTHVHTLLRCVYVSWCLNALFDAMTLKSECVFAVDKWD